MKRILHILLALLTFGGLTSCLQPADPRVELDRSIGKQTVGEVRFEVDDGLAQFRQAEPGEVVLWLQAPVITIRVDSADGAPQQWLLRLWNVMPDAELEAVGGDGRPLAVEVRPAEGLTRRAWRVDIPAGEQAIITVAPPDADRVEPYRFAVLSDVQDRIDEVEDIYELMNATGDIRFVVSTGDLTEQGTREQHETFQEKLEVLEVPLYSTVGNHELGAEPEVWADMWGRANFNFSFKGVSFSLIDSGNATIDPTVYDWLQDWLDAGRDRPHVFLTHYSPIDPVGLRNGSFRSRREAGKLLYRLAEANVDLTLYGHVHSYYAFTNGGIPAYISGGGGAIPERMDGIERHFLIADVVPSQGVEHVSIVRVD